MTQIATIPSKALSDLKDLVRVNIDSAEGLRAAADTIESQAIATLFRQIAQDRDHHAAELQQSLAISGAEIPDSGSVSGTIHKWWVEARGKLNGGDDRVVLIEAERGEDKIKERYEEVLPQIAGTALNDVLNRQYAEVKQSHDHIRDLRDSKK